jgi:hypothetical protein
MCYRTAILDVLAKLKPEDEMRKATSQIMVMYKYKYFMHANANSV